MKTQILYITLLMSCWAGFAQQDSQYTQYMYNTINVNPAYAGSRGVISVFGLYRTQWVGLDGAPETNAFSINAPINNSKVGVGLSFVNDRIGPTQENLISADVSYYVMTSETWKMSFGIKASANLFSLNRDKLNPEFEDDPSLAGFTNKFSPNIGAGVYFHNDKAYVGLSLPNFIQTDHYNDNDIAINKERMNFYLVGGYVFDLNPVFKFKPAALVKAVGGAPLQIDVSGNFMYDEKFILGGAYRWDAAWSALAGFQITNKLLIGYAYDGETTRLRHYNSGSHEIFLRYEFWNNFNRITSPRFF